MSEDLNSSPSRKLNTPQVILILIIGVLIMGWLSGVGNQSSTSDSPSQSSASDSSWIPAGFDSWDENLAYKWVENPTCNDYSTCAAIQVVSNVECPSNLYAELILQDENYVQYNYTNDSQGSLSKGSTAELTFNFLPDERFSHFKLSKISCH